jgi:hypothetical protein
MTKLPENYGKERSTIIDQQNYADAPVQGARKVYFKESDTKWNHVGWLMPEIGQTYFRRGR